MGDATNIGLNSIIRKLRSASGSSFSISTNDGVRQRWIDCVKGLTIVMVVFHHNYSGFRSLDAFSETTLHLYALLSPIRMPLFFLVAGFFAKKSILGPFDAFARHKLLHFAYFYLVWNVISITLRASLASHTTHDVGFGELLNILWKPNFTLWFLYGLLLAFSVARLTRAVPLGVQIAVAIAAAVIDKSIVGGTENVFLKTVQLYPLFLVGVYGSEPIRNWVSKARWPRVLALFSVCGVILTISYWTDSIETPHVYYLTSAFTAATVMSTMFLIQHSLLGRVFAFLGAHSLYIYLLHFFPAAAGRIAAHRLGLDSHVWLTIAFGTVFSVIFCLVAYFVANKIPGLRYLYRTPDFERIIPRRNRGETAVPRAAVSVSERTTT
jgi:uncharacterized membrane protein YcfT